MKKSTLLICIYLMVSILVGCSQITKEDDIKTQPAYVNGIIAPGLPNKDNEYRLVTEFVNVFYTFDYRYEKQTYYDKNKSLMTEKLYSYLERSIKLNYLEENMSVLTALTIEGFEQISPNIARVFVDMYYKGTSTFGFPLEEIKEDHLRGYIEIVTNNDQWLVDNIDIKNLGPTT